MPTRKKSTIEFDTIAAIRELEAKKEERRAAKLKRDEEKARKAKEKAESDRIAEYERRLQSFKEDSYFRLQLIDAITSLTQEVGRLNDIFGGVNPAKEDIRDTGIKEILHTLASCVEHSYSSGKSQIRARYIPRDYS